MKKNKDNFCCPVCNSRGKMFLGSVKDIHYNIAGQYNILHCENCSLKFLSNDVVIPTNFEDEFYNRDNYYAYKIIEKKSMLDVIRFYWIIRNRGYQFNSIKIGLTNKIGYYLLLPYIKDFMWWIPYYRTTKRTFIDIGCGSGKMVKFMETLGFEAWGTDISVYGSRMGENAGLDKIVTGDFREVNLPESYFDYVYSSHAIEHISEPNRVFKKIWKILKPGGIGYICVPNAMALTSKLFGKYWYFLGAPLHVVNYDSASIKFLLEKHNFNILKIRAAGDSQGLIGSIQAFLNRNNNKNSQEGLIWNGLLFKLMAHFLAYFASPFKIGSHLQVQFRKPLN